MINNKTLTLIEREFSKKGYYIFDFSKENKSILNICEAKLKIKLSKIFH